MDSSHYVPPPASLSALSRSELEALLLELFGELAALKQIVAEQREEIARLKGLKGRPSIKPSGMDKGTEPPRPSKQERRRGRGRVTPRVNIEEKTIKAVAPSGSRFKGYQPILVQDLAISVCATCYRRERWITPDGNTRSRDRHSVRQDRIGRRGRIISHFVARPQADLKKLAAAIG